MLNDLLHAQDPNATDCDETCCAGCGGDCC